MRCPLLSRLKRITEGKNNLNDIIEIEVINWDKFNPRTDSKKPTWFRFENDLATGPTFYGLDSEQKWLWVIILSLVSQKNGQAIKWNYRYVESISGISKDKQDKSMNIFEEFSRLRVSRKNLPVGKYLTLRLNPATNERDETNETNETRRTNELVAPAGADALAESQRDPLVSDSLDQAKPVPKISRPKKGVTEKTLGSKIFDSYSQAYERRHGVKPVRDRLANAHCKAIGEALGDEGVEVAEFYVKHNKAFYTTNYHPLNLFRQDAPALRTQWATGRMMTSAEGRDIENKQQILNTWGKHITPEGGSNGKP